jgi:hypothetical protein
MTAENAACTAGYAHARADGPHDCPPGSSPTSSSIGGPAAASRADPGLRVAAFHPAYRRSVLALVRSAGALADLTDSFPALLFALASGYADAARRERARALVLQGASLRAAADAIGLAWWLRKLPPQAFAAPLPRLPADPDFSLRIASLLPGDGSTAATWLRRVAQALQTAGRDYALWIARQPDLAGRTEDFFALLAAWAWFSGQPGLLGNRLVRKPWTAAMSFRRAGDELAAWRQRLRLADCLGPGIETPWLADGSACGLSFVALRTVDDFIAESAVLGNCLDQYADHILSGTTAVFSIRRGSRSVACVEIGVHDEEVTMPTVVQLRAERNRRAPPEVWQATFAWLGSQRLAPLAPKRHVPQPKKRLQARRRLWRPYLEHLGGTHQELDHERALARAIKRLAHGGRPARWPARMPLSPAQLRPTLALLHSRRAAE